MQLQFVSEGTSLPPKPQYSGIFQVAEVQAQLNGDALTFNLSNSGYGYVSPPKVVIDNFGTGGTGASFSILQSDIDSLTGEIKNIQSATGGSGYTSLPQIRLEGGFPYIEASGIPARAVATAAISPPSPDDDGRPRAAPGLTSIGVVSRGSGYSDVPVVQISHPTAEGALAVAVMGPAANGRGDEVRAINVTVPGGGKPIDTDDNSTQPTAWLPGYDVPRTSVSLIGGLPIEEVTFEFSAPVFTDPQSVLSSIKFYAVGDNQHRELPELNDNPFRWTWGAAQPSVYGLYAEVVDSRGNVSASDPIFREIRPGSLPEGDFTSPYRARGEAIINADGNITGIDLLSPGASYNLPPKIIFEGDGSGAAATTTIDLQTGKVTQITMVNQGSGYTTAKIRFEEGWVTPQQVDEYVLGETISIGLTAYAKSAEIQKISLIVNGDVRTENNVPPKSLVTAPDFGGYQFPFRSTDFLLGRVAVVQIYKD